MKNNSLLLIFGFAASLFACDPINEISETVTQNDQLGLNTPSGFDFSTTTSVNVDLSATGSDNSPLSNVVYKIYKGNPHKEGTLLQTVQLDELGNASITIDLPSYLKEVFIASDYIGVEPMAIVPVSGGRISYSFDATNPSVLADEYFETNAINANERISASSEEFMTLGSWSSEGKPKYLVESDRISDQLLKNINSSLPENEDLRKSNPEAISDKYKRELFVSEDAEVWVTYVHTGGSYRNAIGYYWYKEGEAPKTADEIKNKTIIFPNAQSGVLRSGNKVKLVGPKDGAFEKDTYIGWFLISNGWQGGKLTYGNGVFYADKNLNTFNEKEELRDQMVFLYDATEQILLMGWEDIRRDYSSCDHDFNDVMFYASWNPITSVDLTDYVPIDTDVKDKDEDGVADSEDEYPEDPERAFNNYSPGENTFGTLLFEDLWPSFGDYDMNDLVIDYNVNEISNGNNRIKEIKLTTVVRATGAGYRNGFGIQLPVSSDQVLSVEGTRLSTGSIKTLSSGVEQGQKLATIIVMDDVNDKLPVMANVFTGNTQHGTDTVTVKIVFKESVRKADLGAAPYNPFMIINQDRGREVHLMNMEPTDLMDTEWFSTADDISSIGEGTYFTSNKGFNWALHIPQSISYAQEKVDFTKAYTKFSEWAKSGGLSYEDWYLNIDGQVNSDAIYK
ncbi:LruC domain-containing protein [Cyclobacterium marinum]|uniref:LruC domain-containing protein n=1 Tax=Cyclobacterium marinum TaxID=104 RepID=UPI0011F03F02|nr:LruC domain-containing protein [Cyclobacterium marinum]MBI0399058.1 LruC domain-containing protein [Cyclobacterium marinum]